MTTSGAEACDGEWNAYYDDWTSAPVQNLSSDWPKVGKSDNIICKMTSLIAARPPRRRRHRHRSLGVPTTPPRREPCFDSSLPLCAAAKANVASAAAAAAAYHRPLPRHGYWQAQCTVILKRVRLRPEVAPKPCARSDRCSLATQYCPVLAPGRPKRTS